MVKRQNLHFLQFHKFRQLFRLVNKSGVKFFPSVFTHRAWTSLTFVDLRWRFLFLNKLPNSILQQKYRHCMDIAKLGKPTNMYKVGNLLLLISSHCTLKVGTHQATSCSNTSRRQITPCVQVGWLVAATRWGDPSQRQIASCVLENFCENLCLRNRILSLQQVAKNQIRLNLCDLLRRQNSVAATKIFTKFSTTHEAICRCNVSLRHVAATCHLVCTDL